MEKPDKISVCFIAPKAYPLFNPQVEAVFGGSEVDLYYLARELARDRDFAVSFVVADYGQPVVESIKGVTVIKSLDFSRNSLSGALRIWRALGRADARIYLIKTASWGNFLTALFCRRRGRIFLYRSSCSEHCDGTFIRQHRLAGVFYRWALHQAKKIFVQNDSDIAALAASAGVSSMMIPNGHPLGEINLDETEAARRDIILWVGRSDVLKAPAEFIELARNKPDEKFVMVCQRATGDDQYEQLRRRAQAVENLEFYERVPFERVDEFFRRAKMLVNTSRTEGFSNTFIQAGKYAAPILSLEVNPDDFLTRYGCGLCCRQAGMSLAEGLNFMLEQDRRRQMGGNCREYVRQHHDIREIIKQYKQIFTMLATGD